MGILRTRAWQCAALGAVAILPCPSARAGTVGHWRFEGLAGSPLPASVSDSSGEGLSAATFGTPTFNAAVPPAANVAPNATSAQFDGFTQRLFVPDAPVLALTHGLTIEAFVNPQPMLDGTGGGGNILVRGDTRPALDPYRLTLLQPGNVLAFSVTDGSGQSASLQTTVQYGQWVHLAGTLDDATGAMTLYVNGAAAASTVTPIHPMGDLDPTFMPGLGIGGDGSGQYGELFHGLLDEVRLSDVALTPSQFLLPEPGSAGVLVGLTAFSAGRRRSRPLPSPAL